MTISKRTVMSWQKKIEKHMAGVAKERDKIDETISELAQLKEDCDEAYDLLQDARDRLSQLV